MAASGERPAAQSGACLAGCVLGSVWCAASKRAVLSLTRLERASSAAVVSTGVASSSSCFFGLLAGCRVASGLAAACSFAVAAIGRGAGFGLAISSAVVSLALAGSSGSCFGLLAGCQAASPRDGSALAAVFLLALRSVVTATFLLSLP